MSVRPVKFILAFAVASGSAALVSVPLPAAGLSSQQQPTNTIRVTAPESSRQICTTERPTGSRFARRVCRSAADRDADRQMSQDGARDFQAEGFSSPGDPAAGIFAPDGTSVNGGPQ